MSNGILYPRDLTPPKVILDLADNMIPEGDLDGRMLPKTGYETPHDEFLNILRKGIENHKPYGFWHLKRDGTVRFVNPTMAVVFHRGGLCDYWCRLSRAWRSMAAGSLLGLVRNPYAKYDNNRDIILPSL